MKLSGIIERLRRNAVGREALAVIEQIGRQKIASKAAALAFYFFLALIPLFTLLCSLLPYTGISTAALTEAIGQVTPEAVHGLTASIVREAYSSRVSVFSLSCVVLVWSSAKRMTALIRALDAIYGKDGARGYFAVVSRALLYTLGLLAAAGALLFFYAKGHSLEEIIGLTATLRQFFGNWARIGKYLLSVALLTLALALIYKLAPAGRRKYLLQLPGAAFAAVGVTAFTAFFSWYSGGSNVYNSFYGSLTGVAFLLVWGYSCLQIILIGGVLNATLPFSAEARPENP